MMDELSDAAREIGAVNVIQIRRQEDGSVRLKGFNSDYIGFMESIRPLLSSNHHNALVLGTGGASKAICYALTQLGLKWTLVSRNRRAGILSYEDITAEAMKEKKNNRAQFCG